MFKNIMLAYDGSKHALRAAEKAAFLAENTEGASITIVYVVDSATSKEDVLHFASKEVINETRRKRLKTVEDLLEEKGVSYKHEILHGEAPEQIVGFANSQEFDLVVVGSRGLNGLQEMVLGSVSHKVAKRVKSPVMIIK
ncbi:Nucleotide-binding universal stress protein, UspA family [Mesobacillus persicus]|uniref:Nucleotide-binding universal stress protein, UspA family n=1 Tax=Mesobacillus persicus TaxID=930146 RepID=A0A1H7Z6W7_9BACI|nr:universal stress protein [Mesobacillus persicus]SEM54025.1 Nucleotide-binding universal stress protein, UspA family [Mesobacillus persicus]